MRHGSLGTTLVYPKARHRADRCGRDEGASEGRKPENSYFFVPSPDLAAAGRLGEVQNVTNDKTTWRCKRLGPLQRRNIPSCPKFQRVLEPKPRKRLTWASTQ